MDIFEQEYAQMSTTASEQFDKLAAELDGDNVMNKVDSVPTSFGPGGAEAKTLEAALAKVEASREGRGKITALADRKNPSLSHRIDLDTSPIISSLRDPKLGDPNSEPRTKTASINPISEQAWAAASPVQMMKTAAKKKEKEDGIRFPKLTNKQKGLIAGGAVLGAGGLTAGVGGYYASRKAKEDAQKALDAVGGATETAKETGRKIGRTADTVTETVRSAKPTVKKVESAVGEVAKTTKDVRSKVVPAVKKTTGKVDKAADVITDVVKDVKKVTAPVAAAAEKARETTAKAAEVGRGARERASGAVGAVRDKASEVTQKVKDVGRAVGDKASDVAQKAKDVGKVVKGKVPDPIRRVGGGILRRITKRGSDDSFGSTIAKLGADGQLRTLEGWQPVKTAAKEQDDPYARRVGREGRRIGGLIGGTTGAAVGGIGGARIGARMGAPGRGALVGGLVGGALGGLGGGAALGAISERKARKTTPAQRKQALRYNLAHAKYTSGELSRKDYTRETNKFLESQGYGAARVPE